MSTKTPKSTTADTIPRRISPRSNASSTVRRRFSRSSVKAHPPPPPRSARPAPTRGRTRPGNDLISPGKPDERAGSPRTNPGLRLTPESQDVAAALPLFGAKVLSAVAFKSAALRMVFDSGTHLNCPSDASSEAWRITGPGGWRFVSLPGGDLAVRSGSGRGEKPQGRIAKN
ncbi:DUF6188 family protein [Embleya sp. NBC_00888]|uniref:DUF6188 family protein n=1 Tax=Embleya sp. NBC_00888 TaxID=2975960 RepID=UPI00386855AD